ncbi:MAG: DUF4910 domain-containing protein [Methylocystaceae bacterium]|nr:DUF4910 domain-containing protein [Methylocystaceae bacterium]
MIATEANFASDLLDELFPICRSITGNGVRQTLNILSRTMNLNIHEIPSGKHVYDWVIPKEWNINDAYIADHSGKRVIDFRENNLHVMSYSTPVNARMSFDELRPHLQTLPEIPDAIPYRTSYFKEDWAFCLSQKQLDGLDKNQFYDVVIDSEIKNGHLTLGDSLLEGTSGKEYLISTYCCHPSMANDNLSGPIVSTLLYKKLKERGHYHSYRFVVLPETIGAITYLSENETEMQKLQGGFVVTTCGGPGGYGHKETFQGNHELDRAVRLIFRDANTDLISYPFVPDGSDERQYSSPGFRIPVTTISKDKYYEYPYYHTSLDNKAFVTGENLALTAEYYMKAIAVLEKNRVYRSLNPKCEPQLGKRNLYPSTGGGQKQIAAGAVNSDINNQVDIICWMMFLADGKHDLIDMAERSGYPFEDISHLADRLVEEGLLELIE